MIRFQCRDKGAVKDTELTFNDKEEVFQQNEVWNTIRDNIRALDVKNQQDVLETVFQSLLGSAEESNQFTNLADDELRQLDMDTLETLEEVRCAFKAGNKGSLWSFGRWLFFAGSPVELIVLADCHKFRVIWNKSAKNGTPKVDLKVKD